MYSEPCIVACYVDNNHIVKKVIGENLSVLNKTNKENITNKQTSTFEAMIVAAIYSFVICFLFDSPLVFLFDHFFQRQK